VARFEFRLEKLFEYRQLQEEWAKDAYLASQARRIEGEHEIDKVKARRKVALKNVPKDLAEHVALDGYLCRLDDEERGAEAVLSVLAIEEEDARLEWLEAKTASDALEKLREKDFELWQIDELRREQAALDEWAVLRRAA